MLGSEVKLPEIVATVSGLVALLVYATGLNDVLVVLALSVGAAALGWSFWSARRR